MVLSRWWNVFYTKHVGDWVVLFLGSVAMLIGFPTSRILSRLYYEDGGTSIWLIAWTAVAGWPLIALALLVSYLKKNIVPTRLTWGLTTIYAILGLLSAVDNVLFSWAYAYLPASTASIISASTLPFTAIFAYFMLGKTVTASSFNSIVVITIGAVILALDSSSDRPTGVSNKQYAVGFLMDVAGSALHGLIFTMSGLIFIKYLRRESTHVILEQQCMVSIAGFIFTTIGLYASGEYSAMLSEAHSFVLGSVGYYMVLLWSTISIQVGLLGSVAVVYSASALLAGVLNSVVVPVTSIAAVLLLKDSIDGFKIVSLILTMWGFGSYIYGGLNEAQSLEQDARGEPLCYVRISDEHEIESYHEIS